MYQAHIRALVDAWNTGNLDDLGKYLSENVRRRSPVSMNMDPNSLEELKELIQGFRTEFPDLRVAIIEEMYNEGRSAIRWTFSGTNTGPGDLGMTGNRVELSGCSIHHYDENLLTEELVFFDTAEFFGQLGLTETARAASG